MTNLNELIAELERLDKKATPGPWRAAEKAALGPDIDGMVSVVWDERSWAHGEHYSPTKTQAVANAKIATNLRNHLPQILTALRQAQGEAMSNDKPVELKPGWLAEDVAKATARAAEWTTPAMTAERLAEIARAITPYPGKELFAYIDALHARVTALERERDEARAKALEEAAAFIESEQNEPHWGQDNNRRTAQTTIAECAALIRSIPQGHNAMSDDTTPAPAMTAERLEEIRASTAKRSPDEWGYWIDMVDELIASHDALTARVAELERELDDLRADAKRLVDGKVPLVERALAAEAQLKEARKVFAPVFKNYGPEWPDSEGLEVISSAPDDDDGEEGVGRCDFTLGQLRRALKDTTP